MDEKNEIICIKEWFKMYYSTELVEPIIRKLANAEFRNYYISRILNSIYLKCFDELEVAEITEYFLYDDIFGIETIAYDKLEKTDFIEFMNSFYYLSDSDVMIYYYSKEDVTEEECTLISEYEDIMLMDPRTELDLEIIKHNASIRADEDFFLQE